MDPDSGGGTVRSSWSRPLTLHKRALDRVLARLPSGAFFEVTSFENLDEILEHGRATADHHSVVLGVERGEADVGAELSAFEEVCDAAAILELFAGDEGVVAELLLDHFAEVLVLGQLVLDVF